MDLLNQPLFTLTNNKHLSLDRLMKHDDLAVAEAGDRAADVLMQRNVLHVLSPETLDRFGTESLDELRDRLVFALEQADGATSFGHGHRYQIDQVKRKLQETTLHPDLTAFKDLVSLDFTEIKTSELSKEERASLNAIRRMGDGLLQALEYRQRQTGDRSIGRTKRTTLVMVSSAAEAMTDGFSKIWIDRNMLKETRKGLPGFVRLLNLMAHEYTHQASSQGSHLHDQAFFESFHDTVMNTMVSRMAVTGLAHYVKHTGTPTSTLLTSVDMALTGDHTTLFLNDADTLPLEEEDDRTLSAVDATAPVPVRKRRSKRPS